MDKEDPSASIWTTNSSAENVLADKPKTILPSLSSPTIASDSQIHSLPRKHSPPSSSATNLHESLVRSIKNHPQPPPPLKQGSSSSSSPTSSVTSSRITAINLHHHNNLLANKKPVNAHNIHCLAPFGSGQTLNGYSGGGGATKELVASSIISGSSVTLQAAAATVDRTGSGSVAGRETPFSFFTGLTSTNRLNCLGGSSPGVPGDQTTGGYWKHHPQPQQFHNSTSTYPHSQYNGGGGGGGGGHNSNSNQKVNI